MKLLLLAPFFLISEIPNSVQIRVIDGDTLVINSEKIRLLGIDAPEFHCRKNKICAPGDPQKSKEGLEAAIKNKNLEITRFGTDLYGRTIAIVKANGVDLSCHQLKNNLAIYVEKWDGKGQIAKCIK